MARTVQDRHFAFDSPVSVDDLHGGREDGWTEAFRARASVMNLRGRESVIAARLQGVQPIVVTIRRWTESEAVTTGWRLRDVDDDTEYQVTSVAKSENRRDIEITAQSGANG